MVHLVVLASIAVTDGEWRSEVARGPLGSHRSYLTVVQQSNGTPVRLARWSVERFWSKSRNGRGDGKKAELQWTPPTQTKLRRVAGLRKLNHVMSVVMATNNGEESKALWLTECRQQE